MEADRDRERRPKRAEGAETEKDREKTHGEKSVCINSQRDKEKPIAKLRSNQYVFPTKFTAFSSFAKHKTRSLNI